VPCLAQTGNVLRKLALDLLALPFERLDSLVCLRGELLGQLQKQLPQLPNLGVLTEIAPLWFAGA
jgi:hypothetical protein